MITVISGTNRINSQTKVLSNYAAAVLKKTTPQEVHVLDLCQLNGDILIREGYTEVDQTPLVISIQDDLIIPALGFYFVIPEYNGSFPGILKYFLDACSVRNGRASFFGKKAANLGLSSGRAGNLRGLDHLTSILHYLNIHVMPNRLPVSKIAGLIAGDELADPDSRYLIQSHIEDFIEFCH